MIMQVAVEGESALVTFKDRAVAERVKRLKSGKEMGGKTILIRWKEGYTPPPKTTEGGNGGGGGAAAAVAPATAKAQAGDSAATAGGAR